MPKSRNRLVADWFAKIRENATTGEVEHTDIVDAETTSTSADSSKADISYVDNAISNISTSFEGLSDTTVSTSNPTHNTNATVGHIWINKTTGQEYVCTDATTNENVWTNVGKGTTDVVPSIPISYLVVAGGGGGGRGWNAASGGGAGGYRNSFNNETSGRSSTCETPLAGIEGTTYNITVGAGGGSLSNGGNSSFGSITSQGGARGWSHQVQGGAHTVANGGCGCGSYSGTPGQGVAGQGHDGMEGMNHTLNGGGGGAGEGGLYHVATGGDGLASTITGTSVMRGGGGGSCNEGGTRYAGGAGGGGSNGGGGAAHTGGGGSASPGSSGSSGGSGIVIIRVATSKYSGTYSGSPSVSTVGSDTVLVFTGSGSYTA